MQEAEIDNTSDRIKKRRRSTEPGTDNISALVPRQVRVDCPYDVMRARTTEQCLFLLCVSLSITLIMFILILATQHLILMIIRILYPIYD